MPGTEESKVPVDPTAAVVPANESGTPAAEGVAEATPSQSTGDAEALERERQEFLDKQKNLQKDINRLKSLSQSREAQIKREAAEREMKLRQELEQIRLSTMDDETRKTYEAQSAQQRIQELEERLAENGRMFEDYKTRQSALSHFRKLGVPEEILNEDVDLDSLLQNGWDWVSEQMISIRQSGTGKASAKPAAPAPLPKAPPVDTGKGTPASSRPSWEEAEKKWGSREKIYQLFQEGRIKPGDMPE